MDEDLTLENEDERDFTLPAPLMSHEAFLAWRSPREGQANPSDLSNPLWTWLVRSRLDAYNANEKLNGPSAFQAGPMWCFRRFGMSRTVLPDGRVVHVAGEHEDHYDPDFHIYNDVIVVHPDGEVLIYGYPKQDFPPTDFHTATLVGERLVLVGSLGYPQDRQPGVTQVLELNLRDFSVRRVATQGDAPGWLSGHAAVLDASGSQIIVHGGEVYVDGETAMPKNVDEWALDLGTWTWTQRTRRDWPQWWFIRHDRRRNHLWELRQMVWYAEVGWQREHDKEAARLLERLGFVPDPGLLDKLYQPWSGIEVLPVEEDAHGIHLIRVDGIVLRIDEHDGFGIMVQIQGELAQDRWHALRDSLLMDLRVLEGVAWEVLKLPGLGPPRP